MVGALWRSTDTLEHVRLLFASFWIFLQVVYCHVSSMFDKSYPDMFWHVCSNTSDRRFCNVFALFAQTFLTGGVAMF